MIGIENSWGLIKIHLELFQVCDKFQPVRLALAVSR